MQWTRRVILSLLLTVPCLALAASPHSKAFGRSEAATEPTIYREGFLQVVSPDGATRQQAQEMAKKVLAAWKFDLDEMQWGHPAEMQRPLTLRLVSHDRLQSHHAGIRASASRSGNKFTVDVNLIGDESIDRTFAHELGHVQMFRALGKYSEPSYVPTYFLEGHGQMLNQLYGDHLGLDGSGPGARIVRSVMSFSAEEAHEILTDPNYFKVGTAKERANKEAKMERMGLYFVEYLSVRKNIPDAVPRMGRVGELVGRGKKFGQAFKQAFGLPLDRTVSEMVTYFQRTEAEPADRVKGTRFEAYLK